MSETVLVTGGKGFIGSQVVDLLIEAGRSVRVIDNLHPAAHRRPPAYLNPEAEYIDLDLEDETALGGALDGVSAISHQAAMVGLGKDFGDAEDYVSANCLGTARLLSAISRKGFSGALVLASSMVVYGEGGYICAEHGRVKPLPRRPEDLDAGRFEPRCPACSALLSPCPVPEDAPTDPRSVYAATKLHQEHLCSLLARENERVRYTALRYHNIYGPRMPRDTPYAGVASIFRSSLESGQAPRVFEDGNQIRDFVHVRDVARANLLALDAEPDQAGVYNIASGRPGPLLDMANLLSAASGHAAPAPVVTGEFRLGDVRHVFADATRARETLRFEAEVGLEEGMAEFAGTALR